MSITTAAAAPLALVRVYIRNMVAGKRYLVRTRDLDTQIYNGDVYATFKGRVLWNNDTDKQAYLEEFIEPEILQDLKNEYEVYKLTEDTDIENPMSFFSFVMSVELGIGFVFQDLIWGSTKDTGFFEDIEGDVY
jgi:hypothetical protein